MRCFLVVISTLFILPMISSEGGDIDVVRYLSNLDAMVFIVKEAIHNATLETLSPDVDYYYFYWTQAIALTDKKHITRYSLSYLENLVSKNKTYDGDNLVNVVTKTCISTLQTDPKSGKLFFVGNRYTDNIGKPRCQILGEFEYKQDI